MAKPNLLVVTWLYDEQPGFQVYRHRLEALSARYEVTLLLRNRRFVSEFEGLRIECVILSTAKSRMSALVGYIIRSAVYARRHGYGRVFLLGTQLAMCRLTLPWRTRTALYWNEHPSHIFGVDRFNPLKLAASRALIWLSFVSARHVDLVMPIGQAMLEDLHSHSVVGPRVRLMHMGVDPSYSNAARSERRLAARKSPPLRLVYAGSISRERGRDVMLIGLAMATRGGLDFHLTLVGADDEQIELCNGIAKEQGICNRVSVLGRVPGHEMPALLGEADAGICLWEDRPWWRFNPPTKLFEYMVAGLPVLASRIRTHTDYVQDGENGFLFDYGPEGFSGVLRRLAQHADMLPSMGEQAQASGACHVWSSLQPLFIGAVSEVFSEEG